MRLKKPALFAMMLISTTFASAQKDDKEDLKRRYDQATVEAQRITWEEEEEAVAKWTAQDNKIKGEAFLKENKKKKGVITLPSGLQYKILKKGTGRKPAAEDTVQVHYRSYWINGRSFYNSEEKYSKPLSLTVKKLIPGLREALTMMPVGSKWQLVIPPELAYGENGFGAVAGNATVIYEIELFGIAPPS